MLANGKTPRCIGRRFPKWISGAFLEDPHVDILQRLANLVRVGALNLACVKRTAVRRIGVLIATAGRIVLGVRCGYERKNCKAAVLHDSPRKAAVFACVAHFGQQNSKSPVPWVSNFEPQSAVCEVWWSCSGNQTSDYGVISNVEVLQKIRGISLFGLTYSSVLLLVLIPAAVFYLVTFGYGRRGIKLRIALPPIRGIRQQEGCVVISVLRPSTNSTANEVDIRLNGALVSAEQLRRILKLTRPPGDIVFIEGDGTLELSDIVRVIDIARDVRPGASIVLLTPALKRTLSDACAKTDP
jgi:hypothetical protein